MMNHYEEILNIYNSNKGAAICTIVNTKGSTPRRTGAKMIVYENGEISGTIGGGALEKSVIKDAVDTIKQQKPRSFRHDLVHQHNMCCGGTVDIYIEPIMKKNNLYIFGAGHVGQALARFASRTTFNIVLIDDRKEFLDTMADDKVAKMFLPFEQALQLLPFDDHTYICIMTYEHPVDRDILAYCVHKPHAYLGMIGSRRKVEKTKKNFETAMVAEYDALEEVDMPMGLDIHAEGPEEIAISILAKLIQTKNTKINGA
jgi:xanthine dehydrogenase accessory factor